MLDSNSHLPKRVLVRWSDDLDKELLLAVQDACAEVDIKIPWSRVAEVMGPTFTEGSIVQHLAKLRIKMEQNVMHVPPLKSGMVTESSKMHATSNKKRRAMETSTLEQTDESVRRTEGNGCGGGQRAFSEQDDELSLSMLYDRNGIYGTAKKARRSRRPAVEIKERDFDMLTAAAATCQTSIGRDDSGPAARTPGRIRDHAKMEIGASDEGFEDNQDKVGADANKGVDAEKCAKLWIMGTTRAGRGLGEQVSPCFQATPVGNCQNLLGSPFGGNSEVGGQFLTPLAQMSAYPNFQTASFIDPFASDDNGNGLVPADQHGWQYQGYSNLNTCAMTTQAIAPFTTAFTTPFTTPSNTESFSSTQNNSWDMLTSELNNIPGQAETATTNSYKIEDWLVEASAADNIDFGALDFGLDELEFPEDIS